MSLNWSVSKVKNWQEVCYVGEGDERRLAGKIEGLLWALLVIGFPPGPWEINEDNWQEVFKRMHIYEKVSGPMCQKVVDGKPVDSPFKADEIKALIGLSCNAGCRSKAEFKKKMFEILENDAADAL